MKYIKMLGFYFFEVTGSIINLACAVFGRYPSLELGVRFLLILETKRVLEETTSRQEDRANKEKEARDLELEARNGYGEDI